MLTQIDVKYTLIKIVEDFRAYAILGACNPPPAHRALSHDGVVELMLPCNVTVGSYEDDSEFLEIATESCAKLERVVNSMME